MNTASLLRELDDMFPFASAGKWDRVGLQIGGFDREVGLVGVCHEVTENVVAEAMSLGATAIVTYHPLLFASTSSLIAGPTPEGRALRLAAADIDVISIHTALDVATPGTADALLDRLHVRLLPRRKGDALASSSRRSREASLEQLLLALHQRQAWRCTSALRHGAR